MTYDDFQDLPLAERQALIKEDCLAYDAMVAEHILRPLATQASPGPWYRNHGCVTASMKVGPDGKPDGKPYYERFLFNVERERGYYGTEADARWICAANPRTITKLLDLVQALKAERDALKATA